VQLTDSLELSIQSGALHLTGPEESGGKLILGLLELCAQRRRARLVRRENSTDLRLLVRREGDRAEQEGQRAISPSLRLPFREALRRFHRAATGSGGGVNEDTGEV
jgi:hypothetical protein